MKVKNKKSETEKFGRCKRIIYATIAIVTVLILTVVLLFFFPHQLSQPKAAIIDQLSSSQLSASSRHENKMFVETAKELLYKRFSEVDYYSDNATVDQYKHLPSLDYKLIVWRVHSAVDPEHYVAISTSERYVQGKYDQYSEDQLKLCNITGDPYLYFAITPDFVKDCMDGRFEDTVVILMSCNGLNHEYYKTAQTFVERGVKVFISWDGWIGSSDNDNAITLLLQYLINENNTIREAVNKIPKYSYSVGYPPSRLGYYPTDPEIADYRIPNYKQNNIASNAGFAVITILRKNFRLKLD
jgi:hypothetical protein